MELLLVKKAEKIYMSFYTSFHPPLFVRLTILCYNEAS